MRTLSPRGIVLVEVMVMLVIISLALTVGFVTLGQGKNLSQVSENRVKAINIAREGIEIVTNIRDTNYKKMSSSPLTCWMVTNYDTDCANSSNPGDYSAFSGRYVTSPNLSLRPWTLSGMSASLATSLTGFETYLTPAGTQQGLSTLPRCVAGAIPETATGCLLPMWRQITITPTGTGAVIVSSTVRYMDPPQDTPITITLTKTLTNWGVNLK